MPTARDLTRGGLLTDADARAVPFNEQDDTPIALLIRYDGTAESGLVEVDASGDLIFTVGDLGSEAADTSISTDGTIDVSGASENTWGEVVDAINAGTNWQAVLVDVPRSGTSTDGLLLVAATQCKVPEGAQYVLDTSTAFQATRLIAPNKFRTDIQVYEKDYARPRQGDGSVDPAFPFKGTRSALHYIRALSTYASGTSGIHLFDEVPGSDDEIDVTLTAGATTAAQAHDLSQRPFITRLNSRLIVGLENSAAMSSTDVGGWGELFRALS